MQERPDSPRSWAIALSACVINTMLSGISRTTGLFYVAIIETYGVSRFQANMPFTLRNIVRNLGGPFVGAIGQRYGSRDITLIGGVFGALGILLCAFVSNITWITILWGGIHGLGVALANTLFQVVVVQYFVKYRATATGIALSGACIGSFVFPILIEYCLDYTGLYGTFLITGALMMHVLPAAIILKEPPWIRPPESTSAGSSTAAKMFGPNAWASKIFLSNKLGVIRESADELPSETNGLSVVSVRKLPSVADISSIPEDDSCYHKGKLRKFSVYDNLAFTTSILDSAHRDSFSNKFYIEKSINNHSCSVGNNTDSDGKVPDQVKKGQSQRPRAVSIGELSISLHPAVNQQLQEKSIMKGIQIVIYDPMFHLISLSLAAFCMMFDPAITVIVDYLMDKGLEAYLAKYFITLLSVGDLLGRLCFGWITDKEYLSVPVYMMLLLLVQGVCFLLMPPFYRFDIIIILMIIYGLASGANLVMMPILVEKYLASVQSLAIGSIAFFSGVLSFAIPPIIGYFRDQVGSYDGMFYITGALSVVVGLLWLMEPLLLRLKQILDDRQSASLSPS